MNYMFLLRGLLIWGIALTATTPMNQAQSPEKITIVAHRFAFEPNEITVKKGQEVILVLQSQDVVHGLVVEELGVRTEVKKGQSSEVKVTPQSTGTFQGRCGHFCGAGHLKMTLTVHVTE